MLNAVLCMYLRRAFDYVYPYLLLQCLHSKYNLNSFFLKLLGSYFKIRTFQFSLGSYISTEYFFNSACPQGSTLASLLFMLFFDQVNECISLDYISFADYLVILKHDKSVDEIIASLQKALISLKTWCFTNKLSINFSKTKWMLFSKTVLHDRDKNLVVENECIEKVSTFKYLCLWMDETLSVFTYYEKVVSKVSSAMVWI